jgi:hypothetical protein
VDETRWTGESALAHLTTVNEPHRQVVAVTAQAEQMARQACIFLEPREITDGIAVQV